MRLRTVIIAAIAVLAAVSTARAQSSAPYVLVFDDEFNGTAVDTTKWNVLSNSTIGGGYSNNQFTPANAVVSNGLLGLIASSGSTSGRAYSAAFILTLASFEYGYFEERAQMPANGHGDWPAFWMNDSGGYPEIDIFEWLGDTPTLQYQTMHPTNDATLTGGTGLGSTNTGPDYSAGFHVYGMLWTATSITWFIDGVQTFQLTNGQTYNGYVVAIPASPMQTILNSAVGGFNGNVTDSTTVFPNTYSVDYVHIYSNASNAVAVTPQANYTGPPAILAPVCRAGD